MKNHTKIYLKENGYTTADVILCEVRAEGCENVAVDIMHIEPRGMGGNPSKDRNDNLVAGCRYCHMADEAGLISKEKLKQIAKERIDGKRIKISD